MRTKLSKSDMGERVEETLRLVRMQDYGSRYPRQLSGGQQQRVAMARALVSRPRLLLMDEPLGALDKKLREQMQFEIKRIHRSVGTTFVYVTHDQSEALTMSDLVVLMHRGRIAQMGPPRALYTEPASVFVADFIGDSNLLAGRIVSSDADTVAVALDIGVTMTLPRRDATAVAGQRVALVLRPEEIAVQFPGDPAPGGAGIAGQVTEIGYLGDSYRLSVMVDGVAITVKLPPHRATAIAPGAQVSLAWDAAAARLLPADDGSPS
jgi:ABC-type Fe3+/spermidine/putrescine transport system ATPase subunit